MKTNRTFPCPVCGFEVRQGSASCPQCGSDERTGWSDRTYLDGIDLPDEVDYNEIAQNEFGAAPGKKMKISWIVVVAVLLLLLSLAGFVKILL